MLTRRTFVSMAVIALPMLVNAQLPPAGSAPATPGRGRGPSRPDPIDFSEVRRRQLPSRGLRIGANLLR